jgi:hypothetical protein
MKFKPHQTLDTETIPGGPKIISCNANDCFPTAYGHPPLYIMTQTCSGPLGTTTYRSMDTKV